MRLHTPPARVAAQKFVTGRPCDGSLTLLGSVGSSSVLARFQMTSLAQARYERTLLLEITKLQSAISEERKVIATQKAQMDSEESEQRAQKASESERASRLLEMEKAIELAQRTEQRDFLKKVNCHSPVSLLWCPA